MPWADGFTALPIGSNTRGEVQAVSADGNFVGGAVNPGGACYWTPTSGLVLLGNPGTVRGISADGSVMVGSGGGAPFRWTSATGAVSFGSSIDNVRGISDDASRIVGETNTSTILQACYWNNTGSIKTLMGFLPGHDRSQAAAASADGSVIVGSSLFFSGGYTTQRAWRWTTAGGMVSLGIVAPMNASVGFDVSADGLTVVGQLIGLGWRGYIWTAADGMVILPDDPISYAVGISGDASTIMTHVWYEPDPDTYPYTYLGYLRDGDLTIPVPVPLSPSGTETGAYAFDSCISADGRVMAGFSQGTPPGPWVYSIPSGPAPPKIVTTSELVFENIFVDLNVEANRRKFIAPGGTPAWMERDGSLPFNHPPAVYLTTMGPPLDFTQNNGDGGPFPFKDGS